MNWSASRSVTLDLLLEPVRVLYGQMYRRVGCAQTHRAASFFDEALVESFTLV